MRELSFTSCMIEVLDALRARTGPHIENILEPRATALGVPNSPSVDISQTYTFSTTTL